MYDSFYDDLSAEDDNYEDEWTDWFVDGIRVSAPSEYTARLMSRGDGLTVAKVVRPWTDDDDSAVGLPDDATELMKLVTEGGEDAEGALQKLAELAADGIEARSGILPRSARYSEMDRAFEM